MRKLFVAAAACPLVGGALATSNQGDHETWFEAVAHSVVEYIPLLGTLYSMERMFIADHEEDTARYWQSMADLFESSVRDIVILQQFAEPIPVTLIHTMAESFTDKMIDIYHSWPFTQEVAIRQVLFRRYEYVVVADSEVGKSADQFFTGKAKGLFYFFGARFQGILTEPLYAPDGVKVRMDVPRGFYDGAPIMFTWRWAVDAWGTKNRPEATHARIKMRPGKPMTFILKDRRGAGGWAGYDFWGEIKSRESVTAYIEVERTSVRIDFTKVDGV